MMKNKLILGMIGTAFLIGCSSAPTKKLNDRENDEVRNAMIPNGDLKAVKAILEPKGDISSEFYLMDYATGWSGCLDNIVDYLLQKGIKPSNSEQTVNLKDAGASSLQFGNEKIYTHTYQLNNALTSGCYNIADKIGPMLSPEDISNAVSVYAQQLKSNPPECCEGVKYGGEDGSEHCAVQSTDVLKTKRISNNREAGSKLLLIVDNLCSKNTAYCTAGDRLRSERASYDQVVNSANACNMGILAKAKSDRDAAEKAEDEFWKQQTEEIKRQEKAQQAAYEANPKNIEAEGCSWASRLKMIEETIAYDKKITEESGVIALKARRQGAMLRDYTQKGLNAVKAKYRTKFGKELDLNSCK